MAVNEPESMPSTEKHEKEILERALATPDDEPFISAAPVPVREPGILDHHLPHGSGKATKSEYLRVQHLDEPPNAANIDTPSRDQRL
jgi:hypothetical protein